MTRAVLSQLDNWRLVNPEQDIRGWPLRGKDGQRYGEIRDMIIDTDTQYVEAILLDDGTHVPMRYIRLGDHSAYLREPRPHETTPPTNTIQTSETSTAGEPRFARGDSVEELRLPVIAEEIRVDKREVERGGVRVETRIEERPVNEQVTLRDENVHVERHAVNQAVDPSQIDSLVQEGTFEVRGHGEEVVVSKEARIVEEVVVNKEVEQRIGLVQESVRRTEVDVKKVGDSKADTRD